MTEKMRKLNFQLKFGPFFLATILFGAHPNFVQAEPEREMASRIFQRITGRPLLLSDPRRAQMEGLIADGKMLEAAAIATEEDDFLNITIRAFAAPMSNREKSDYETLNDFILTIMGTVMDKRDFREILYRDYVYAANADVVDDLKSKETNTNRINQFTINRRPDTRDNRHYESFLDNMGFFPGSPVAKYNLNGSMVRSIAPIRQAEAKRDDINRAAPAHAQYDAAGVLTSRAWILAQLDGGTNRRPIETIANEFMCKSLDSMMDASMSTAKIRRDVDRRPGGNAKTFLTSCRGCHGGLDSLAQAYAHFDWNSGSAMIAYSNNVVNGKVKDGSQTNNRETYPAGFIPTDDSFENNYISNQNEALGWRGKLSGSGVKELGRMIANSRAFSSCMVKKAFVQVCQRNPEAPDAVDLDLITDLFEGDDNYRFQKVYQRVAILPQCLKD